MAEPGLAFKAPSTCCLQGLPVSINMHGRVCTHTGPTYNGQVVKDTLALDRTSDLIQLAFSLTDEETSSRKVKQLA